MKTTLAIISAMVCGTLHAQVTDSSFFYYQKAMEAKLDRRYQVASQLLDRSLSFNENNVPALLENALVNLEMRKTDQAKALFAKVLIIEPGNKLAMRELMQLNFSYRQFSQAIELANQCPDCAGAHKIAGISYYNQEEYAKAEKELLMAMATDPTDAEACYNLARTYLDMEEYKKALPYYTQAVILDPEKNGWIYEKGLLHFTLNDYRNAMLSFQEAAEKGYIQSNDFKENLGYACIYSGEFDKGEALLLSIWEKKPGNKDILRDMAEIFYQQKQFDRSLNYCQKLLEIDDKDGKALYQAGLCFQKKGEKSRGQSMCDKAIEMDPSLAKLRQKKEMPGGL